MNPDIAERREKVARIVDPVAFTPGTYEHDMAGEERRTKALIKAREILALSHPPAQEVP